MLAALFNAEMQRMPRMRRGSLRWLRILCVSAVMAIALVACLYPPALLSTNNNLREPDPTSSANGSAQPGSADLSAVLASVQAKLNELHQAGSFPGATIGFVLPDGRSGSVSVGFADVENKIPLKPTDRMLAGSIGKTYVSAAMLQIVQEGKVDLDARIERWFGGDVWCTRLPNAKDITLRMLMNHSSGIPEHVLNKAFITEMKKDPDRIWKPEELIAYILDAKPLFPAGQGWSYADTNYILAGLIVGAASRLAMRLVALVAHDPLAFTVEGSVGTLAIVSLASIFPGIIYALTRHLLPWPEAARGLLFGVAMLLVIGLPFFYGALSNGELSRGPLEFGRGLFAALFLLFGLLVGLVAGWLASHLPAPRRSVGSVAGYSALLLAGLIGLAVQIQVLLLVYLGIGAS
jgi:hypothetical protein